VSGPLDGWAIAQVDGLTLIGRASGFRLSPVFELKPQMAMGRDGAQLAHMALPVWLLGIDSYEVPEGVPLVPCEELTREQRVRLQQAVDMAARMQADLRNEGARVSIAAPSVLDKLPRMPGQ